MLTCHFNHALQDLNIIIDSSSCLNVPLYKLEENLSLKLEEYRKIKMDRMSRYEALKERVSQLISWYIIFKFFNELPCEYLI